MLKPRTTHHSLLSPHSARGWSLVEIMVVMTIMGVLISMSFPSFNRSLEQARADIAGANLRAIWAAEKMYWLENRTYTSSLSQLQTLGLIDPAIVSATTVYVYAIPSATSSSFTATATRTGSSQWSGALSINAPGDLTGSISAPGMSPIVPGFK